VSSIRRLSAGPEIRTTGPTGRAAVVCVNGGQRDEVKGTWSASLEWLVSRLAPRFPELGFVEVRYRIKSWNRLDWCIEDALAAIDSAGAERTLLLGYSMGGAVAIAAAKEPTVAAVVGLAPWIPDQLSVETLRGKRLDVLHGSFDGRIPGIPGVSPESSRRGFERVRALGVEGSYTLLQGALHGIAARGFRGRTLFPLPRAHEWERQVAARLDAFGA
jgi:pimeloyl-ACP methyl ester carboxylesterase